MPCGVLLELEQRLFQQRLARNDCSRLQNRVTYNSSVDVVRVSKRICIHPTSDFLPPVPCTKQTPTRLSDHRNPRAPVATLSAEMPNEHLATLSSSHATTLLLRLSSCLVVRTRVTCCRALLVLRRTIGMAGVHGPFQGTSDNIHACGSAISSATLITRLLVSG